MKNIADIRWTFLRVMYLYTAVGAGLLGFAMILAPCWMIATFNLPIQDPLLFSIVGSVYTAFGILALFGMKYPLRFVPVLFLQMIYKSVWIIIFVLRSAPYAWPKGYPLLICAVFISYVVGDIYAIPFKYLLRKEE